MENSSTKNSLDQLRQAVDLNPSDPAAHVALGEAYSALGKSKQAQECLKKAAELGDKTAQELLQKHKAKAFSSWVWLALIIIIVVVAMSLF
jgi:cytochrome c-type biogenesis protein CcmH/NrfG